MSTLLSLQTTQVDSINDHKAMTAKLWRINFKKNLSYDIIEAAEQPPYTANVSRFGCAISLSSRTAILYSQCQLGSDVPSP
jgi:hypothetical protein